MKYASGILLAAIAVCSCSSPVSGTPVTSRDSASPLGNQYLTLSADFDGDGRDDQAYFTTGETDYGVWIRRASAGKPVQVATFPSAALDKMGLETFPPGTYEGPCNLDIGPDCDAMQSMTFVLDHTALALFEYEIGQTMIFWNGERFISAAPYE